MMCRGILVAMAPVLAMMSLSAQLAHARDGKDPPAPAYAPNGPEFQTSDRCFACHNGLTTASGVDVSIGIDWRTSVMANSSRDPYWQASVRRESLDHASSQPAIEDECSVCHMPIARYHAKLDGERGQVFAHLPFSAHRQQDREAADGVSCSVCHQISTEKLGTAASFNGEFVVKGPDAAGVRPEFGPFDIDPGLVRVMSTSNGGFEPVHADHVRDSELCATCHTLRTRTLGPDGRQVGSLPEQMPYPEWLHSEYRGSRTCQSCHMPEVQEQAPISSVLGVGRAGVARHEFIAANFFMQRLFDRYHDELAVEAQPQELQHAAERTIRYLQSKAATVALSHPRWQAGELRAEVTVDNLGGHKLPTAFPSRRAWLHVTVRDRDGRLVFESGALRPDGSIQGNDNDSDPTKFEPHYREIHRPDEVQIYESILGDLHGGVTTGLLAAIGYLKDNRLLPHGFDKTTAAPEIAVVGDAKDDPGFTGHGDVVRYVIGVGSGPGPFTVTAQLWYQPIGYRWANNLKPYAAAEIRHFTAYYDSMSQSTATVLASAEAVSDAPQVARTHTVRSESSRAPATPAK